MKKRFEYFNCSEFCICMPTYLMRSLRVFWVWQKKHFISNQSGSRVYRFLSFCIPESQLSFCFLMVFSGSRQMAACLFIYLEFVTLMGIPNDTKMEFLWCSPAYVFFFLWCSPAWECLTSYQIFSK